MGNALAPELRSELAKAIQEARRVGEAGARQALEALAVGRRDAHQSMEAAQKALRTRLRAHGRQVGDRRDPQSGTQEVVHLAHEVAYEHWHRMLFARFLADNHLLVEPESGVVISLEECEELARDAGEEPWTFAARAAAHMLPQIFRIGDPALEVTLPPETRQHLERRLEALPAAVFTTDDSLGWTYQFWQAERKDQVNASGAKVGADELPAVTQLFTEPYMVQFLLHNTIGAWRAGQVMAARPELAETADGEEALRDAVRLQAEGGYGFDYLRFVRERRDGDEDGNATGPWRPAAGTFSSWPRWAAGLKVLDPCCGSGHFLVEGFELVVRLRMDEEGMGVETAIWAVLEENLFGLEIDPRCTQIAAFNVALAAWKLAGGPIELPPLQIACSGLAPHATEKEWLALAEDLEAAGGMPSRRDLFERDNTLLSAPVRGALSALYKLFQQAPELGSLIDPRAFQADMLRSDFGSVQSLLARVLERDRASDEQRERAVAAQGMARAAELLTGTYTLVITNVPYLGRGNQSETLRQFADQHYVEAKADLATMFVARIFRWLGSEATQAVVTPQNWLFLTSYRRLRERLLSEHTWNVVARLGPGAFETIGGHVVNVALVVLSGGRAEAEWKLVGIDVSAARGERAIRASEKALLLKRCGVLAAVQSAQAGNPDSRITGTDHSSGPLLDDHVSSIEGLTTGDADRFVGRFWERSDISGKWSPFIQGVDETVLYGGRSDALLWEDGIGQLRHWPSAHNFPSRKMNGRPILGERGLRVSQMGTLSCTLYMGEVFGKNSATVVPHNPNDLVAIWIFCSSGEFRQLVRATDSSLKITNGTLAKVPFDLPHWQQVAAEKYPNGLPEPQSDDPTQWLFHGHPAKAEPQAALQVAVARLLGYRWPPEHDPDMRLAPEAREWVERCRALHGLADADGIVCLSAARGESGAADRVRRLLAAAFGSAWSPARERELLAAAAGDGQPGVTLEEWLRDRFFEEHCKLFHHRPFVWHLWDGRRDGFHALVSYHRLAGPGGEGRRTLETLTYSYLGDWIQVQRAEQAAGEQGSDARLAAALDLQGQLERILAGEPPCDLFVRWKSLHEQPIGWDPDIDDGVRLNIRPFLRADLRTGGRKGAGLLRWKPNVKWGKDRGKEPESLRPKEAFPWFWSCPGDGSKAERTDFSGGAEFDGNRWNDLHTTTKTKVEARRHAREEQPG